MDACATGGDDGTPGGDGSDGSGGAGAINRSIHRNRMGHW